MAVSAGQVKGGARDCHRFTNQGLEGKVGEQFQGYKLEHVFCLIDCPVKTALAIGLQLMQWSRVHRHWRTAPARLRHESIYCGNSLTT